MSSAAPQMAVSFLVREPRGGWLFEEEDVPETPLHDKIIELLKLILEQRAGKRALIARNLGCRWKPDDARVGMDPDLVWIEPPPPEGENLTTLRVWQPDHAAPRVAVEVVSEHAPEKDYLEGPMRGAVLGSRELWVFDPNHFGPTLTGGPFTLQIFRRIDATAVSAPKMEQVYAGDGPAYSEELGAWLHVTDERRLRVADDEAGAALWASPLEAATLRAEAERTRADALAAKLRALGVKVDDNRGSE